MIGIPNSETLQPLNPFKPETTSDLKWTLGLASPLIKEHLKIVDLIPSSLKLRTEMQLFLLPSHDIERL